MTQALDAHLDRHSSTALGVFRILIGLMFAMHGSAKVFGWPSVQGGAAPVGSWPYWWAGVIELVVGLALALGVFARIAALLGAGEMAYAYVTAHLPKSWLPIINGGELAVLYGLAFLMIAFAGAGAFALQRAHRN